MTIYEHLLYLQHIQCETHDMMIKEAQSDHARDNGMIDYYYNLSVDYAIDAAVLARVIDTLPAYAAETEA